ncbi:hypothetical protein JCM21900_001357 [Sporobolomyces salmonicolor]
MEDGGRLPSLPFELIQHIFTLSLPPPAGTTNWTTFSQRSCALRTYALLSRTWRDWAQAELWRHVLLRDEEGVRFFLEQAGHRTPWRTTTLRMGGDDGGWRMDAEGLLGRVLQVFGGRGGRTEESRKAKRRKREEQGEELEELWLVTLRGVDLRELRRVPSLRALYCLDVQLSLPSHVRQLPVPPSPRSLPHLRTLVLSQIELSPSLRCIQFESHLFPSLEVLWFDNQEVFQQIWDADAECFTGGLRVMSPAEDMQREYLEVLREALEEDEEAVEVHDEGPPCSPRTGSVSLSSLCSDSCSPARPNHLVLLSLTPSFLPHLPHYAPSLPSSLTTLRIDAGVDPAHLSVLGEPDVAHVWAPRASTGQRKGESHGVRRILLPAGFLSMLEHLALDEPLRDKPSSDDKSTDSSPSPSSPPLTSPFQTLLTLQAHYDLELVEAPAAPLFPPRGGSGTVVNGRGNSAGAGGVKFQDVVVPWEFLRCAEEILRQDDELRPRNDSGERRGDEGETR